MRIHAEHVFYLDYMLPELPPPAELSLDVHVTVDGDYHALIVGWNKSSPLFVGELGEALSSAEFFISPTWRPAGRLTHRVQDHVVDHLIVALESDVQALPQEDPELASMWLDRAVSCANYLIGHLRVVTGVPGIRPIKRYWKPGHAEFAVEAPHTVRWLKHPDMSPVPMFQGLNGMCSTGAVRAPNRGPLDLSSLAKSMATGMPAALPATLLVDAEDVLTALEIRQAILSIASACEVRIGTYIEEQRLLSKSRIDSVGKGQPFAERYFSLIPTSICGRSLKLEDHSVFDDVQECYRQRNGLAHGGKLRPTLKDMREIDQHHVVHGWISAARSACNWIDSLPLA